jgi:hypothetical protein
MAIPAARVFAFKKPLRTECLHGVVRSSSRPVSTAAKPGMRFAAPPQILAKQLSCRSSSYAQEQAPTRPLETAPRDPHLFIAL